MLLSSFSLQSSEEFWSGRQAAVVLTYDDALDVHLDHVIPVLMRYGIKATFYITADSEGFKKRIEEWRHVANLGYELGNHTLFHPCDSRVTGRDWVTEEKDLSLWSKARFINNIEIANVLLEAVDGQQRRTFAYTCGDKSAGGESIIADIQMMFPGARGVEGGMISLTDVDLYNFKAFSVMGHTAEDLITQVEHAIEQHQLLVFLFHGVGGGHNINVSQQAHDALVKYLSEHYQDVWVPTMLEITDYINLAR
jgi:sialate O-acetylesterase